ncbi:hypothetical protein D3C78_810980 [compost metagenome]
MGRAGLAISIITSKEQFIIRKFSRELGIEILPRSLYGGRVVEADDEKFTERRSSDRVLNGNRERNGSENNKQAAYGNKDARISGRQGQGAKGTAKSNAGKPSSSKSSVPGSARKKDSDKDRKNKGAPKWLKEKRNKD